MIAILLSLVMAMAPGAQTPGKVLPFDIRAKESLVFGKGVQSGETYWDAVITKTAADGVLVKLPYTQKGGKFTFDAHHRISLTPDFKDAEVTTIIEAISGGGISLGVYTIIDTVTANGKFEEPITKVSNAEVDRYVTPFARRTISINTIPGPQSVSIVGKSTIIKRGTTTTRIDTPGVRIASISRMKFAEAVTGTSLSIN